MDLLQKTKFIDFEIANYIKVYSWNYKKKYIKNLNITNCKVQVIKEVKVIKEESHFKQFFLNV